MPMSTKYLSFDERKTRLETVLHTSVCKSQRSLVYAYTYNKREKERERGGGGRGREREILSQSVPTSDVQTSSKFRKHCNSKILSI